MGSSCEHRQSATGTANPAALCVWPQGAVTTRQGSQKDVRKTSEIRQKYVVMCFIESELWFIRGTTMIDITYITCIKDIYIQYHTIEDLEVDIDVFQWW